MQQTGIPAKGRRRRNRGSEQVRTRLVEGAIAEFAANGFDGASTRAIATRADAHQPQINYHFESKDELWRVCLELLLSELDAALREHTEGMDRADDRAMLAAIVRALVMFASRRPELNRIMMHEGTTPSERLTWLVDHHLNWRYRDLRERWERLSAQGLTAPVPPDVLFHLLVGAASLLYANAPEARLLGVDPDGPSIIDAHADALIAMLLPGRQRSGSRS